MAVAVGAIGHEDRLSVVDHLEELRWRLIVSLAVIGVAFAIRQADAVATAAIDIPAGDLRRRCNGAVAERARTAGLSGNPAKRQRAKPNERSEPSRAGHQRPFRPA